MVLGPKETRFQLYPFAVHTTNKRLRKSPTKILKIPKSQTNETAYSFAYSSSSPTFYSKKILFDSARHAPFSNMLWLFFLIQVNKVYIISLLTSLTSLDIKRVWSFFNLFQQYTGLLNAIEYSLKVILEFQQIISILRGFANIPETKEYKKSDD